MLAEKLGLDPLEVRRKNALQVGQPLSTGKIVDEWHQNGCLDALAPFYRKALREAAAAGFGVGSASGQRLSASAPSTTSPTPRSN